MLVVLGFRPQSTRRGRAARLVLAAFMVGAAATCIDRPSLTAEPAALAAAPPELLDRLRADPYNYFRFINHEWTSRVCETFAADLPKQPMVQLHGDAHLEQYALTSDAWGLDDFDDSARGPALVDISRFLGSIDLAARRRDWTRDRDRLFDRFFEGYRRGLSDATYRPAEPGVVRWVRNQNPSPPREAFFAWAETKMVPMPAVSMNALLASMTVFSRIVRRERPELPEGYFQVVRAGWLRIGIGSAAIRKILMRVRGPSDDPADDELLEAKAIRALKGLECLELPKSRPAFRVIVGTHQVGRLQHNILVAGPEEEIPEMAIAGEHLRNWWVRSWEPSYREITLDDLRSVEDLSEVVYDSAVQLGSGSIHESSDTTLRTRSLAAIDALEPRLRQQAQVLVEQMVRGWGQLPRRGKAQSQATAAIAGPADRTVAVDSRSSSSTADVSPAAAFSSLNSVAVKARSRSNSTWRIVPDRSSPFTRK